MNFRLFAHGDEVSTRVAKALQGFEGVRIVKSESEERTMPRTIFTDLIFPISKAARKGEVPRGMSPGEDPVLTPHLDEDDDDAKATAKRIKAYARALDESDDDDEDSKKRKLRAFAKRNGVILRDEDEDADDKYDEDDDSDDAKRKGKRKGGAVTAGPRGAKDADDNDDEMDDDAKRARGVSALKGVKFDHRKTRVSFASTIFPRSDGDRSVLAYDINSPETMSAPRRADAGQDALNREYSDGVLERLSGGLSGQLGTDYDDSAIPNAGGADPWLGTSRDVPNSGAKFMPRGEGAQNHSVDDRGGSLTRPRQDYQFTEPDADKRGDGGLPARLGDMRVMNPGNSGLRGPSAFRPSFNSSMMSVLKSAPRPRPGLFRNIITDGMNRGGSTQPVSKGEE